MFGLSMLSPRVILELVVAALIAGACWCAYNFVYDQGANSVQVKWDAEKLDQAEQTAKLKDDAAKKTADLQSKADKLRSTSNAQIATLNSNLADALAGLHNRPARSGDGDMPTNPSTGPAGCTGAQLFRPDAEFLTRLAAERDRLAVQLGQCQASHKLAREAVN